MVTRKMLSLHSISHILPLVLLPLAHAQAQWATGTGAGDMASKTWSTTAPYPTGLNYTNTGPDLTGPVIPVDSTYPQLQVPCQPGQIYCNDPASFSMCDQDGQSGTKFAPMGPVAPGTNCRVPVTGPPGGGNAPGRIEGATNPAVPGDQSQGGCTTGVTLVCIGESQFSLCDRGNPTATQNVAAGTMCKNGKIIGSVNGNGQGPGPVVSPPPILPSGTGVMSGGMPLPSAGLGDYRLKRDVQKFRRSQKAKKAKAARKQ